MSLVNKVLAGVGQNVSGVVFVGGLVFVYAGVHDWSPAAANVVGGVVAMVVAALPYVLKLLLRVKGPR